VDDTLTISKMVVWQLIKEGFEVDSAESGEAGLKMMKCNAGSYAFVLTDLEIPRMDGHEMTSAYQRWQERVNCNLSSEAKIPHTPVYSMSANRTKQEELRNSESAQKVYDGFISKPITREELATVILSTLD
jgi:CheY-like chemotaxis protein